MLRESIRRRNREKNETSLVSHLPTLITLTFGALLASQNAHPIGRVGNNSRLHDEIDLYSTVLPKDFEDVNSASDGGLVLASGLFTASPPMPADLQLFTFRSQYPSLMGQGKSAIESFFTTSPGITYRKLDIANGALTLLGENTLGYVGVSVCGDGRGYVVLAPKLVITHKAVLEILNGTVFEQPCGGGGDDGT